MKYAIVIILFVSGLTFGTGTADTLEYMNNDELVVVVGLMAIELADSGRAYRFIDLKHGYARKQTHRFATDTISGLKIIKSPEKLTQTEIEKLMRTTWTGEIVLNDATRLNGFALGLKFVSTDHPPVIKDGRICISGPDELPRQIFINQICRFSVSKENHGLRVEIKSDINAVSQSVSICSPSLNQWQEMTLTGINSSDLGYFEISLDQVRIIQPLPQKDHLMTCEKHM